MPPPESGMVRLRTGKYVPGIVLRNCSLALRHLVRDDPNAVVELLNLCNDSSKRPTSESRDALLAHGLIEYIPSSGDLWVHDHVRDAVMALVELTPAMRIQFTNPFPLA